MGHLQSTLRASIFFVDVARRLSYSYEPLYVEISSRIGARYDSSSAIYVHKIFRKRNEKKKKKQENNLEARREEIPLHFGRLRETRLLSPRAVGSSGVRRTH